MHYCVHVARLECAGNYGCASVVVCHCVWLRGTVCEDPKLVVQLPALCMLCVPKALWYILIAKHVCTSIHKHLCVEVELLFLKVLPVGVEVFHSGLSCDA